jgi:hypothetical protein
MDKIFQRIIANNFSELPGLTVSASIPVPANLVNEIIESALIGNKNIRSCHVTIGEDNHVVADVKSPLLPWILHLKLKLFRSVDLTGSPRVRAFLENNILLGRLGALFKALPDGITLYENQVAVDIDTFLTPDDRRLLRLVKSTEVRTEEGKVILDVKIES